MLELTEEKLRREGNAMRWGNKPDGRRWRRVRSKLLERPRDGWEMVGREDLGIDACEAQVAPQPFHPPVVRMRLWLTELLRGSVRLSFALLLDMEVIVTLHV